MKQVIFSLVAMLMSLVSANAQTSGFEGTYTYSANGATATLQLAPYSDGIAGKLVIGNESADLLGTVTGNKSEGLLQDSNNGDMSAYSAVVSGNRLDLTLYIADPNSGQYTPVTLNFNRGTTPLPQASTAPVRQSTSNTTSAGGNIGGSNSAIAKEWKNRLSNTRLTYLDSYSSGYGDSYGGYSVHRTMDICGKGYFTYSGSSNFTMNASAANAYSFGNSGGDGTWSVIDNGSGGAVLQLNFNDGSTAQYRLGFQEGKTYLNGERWFRTTAADGDEYAPASCN